MQKCLWGNWSRGRGLGVTNQFLQEEKRTSPSGKRKLVGEKFGTEANLKNAGSKVLLFMCN